MKGNTIQNMNVAKSIRGIRVKEHEIDFVRQVQGVDIKDIITKYYFSENVLCFQIHLYTQSGETIPYREFIDYMGYKNTLKDLYEARKKDAVVKIPKVLRKMESTSPKVA